MFFVIAPRTTTRLLIEILWYFMSSSIDLSSLRTVRTYGTTASWRPSFFLSSATGEVRIAEKLFLGFHLSPSVSIKYTFDFNINYSMRPTMCFTTLAVFCLYISFIEKYIGCKCSDRDVRMWADIATLSMLRASWTWLILKDSVCSM